MNTHTHCLKCGVLKTPNNCYRDNSRAGGLRGGACKDCMPTYSKSSDFKFECLSLWCSRRHKSVSGFCQDCRREIKRLRRIIQVDLGRFVRLMKRESRERDRVAKKEKSRRSRQCITKAQIRRMRSKRCLGCNAPLQNRGNHYDYCIKCFPVTSHRINYCRHCGVVVRGKSYVCDGCQQIDSNMRKRKVKASVKSYRAKLKSCGCVICNYNKCLSALEFHHLDDKNIEMSKAKSIERIRHEVDNNKLFVLCANCHREVHAGMIDLDERQLGRVVNIYEQKQLFV